MPYRKAAPLLGLTETALYNLIRARSVPACRIGGRRGRWYCDVDMVREKLSQRMEDNLNNEEVENFLFPKIRRIGG